MLCLAITVCQGATLGCVRQCRGSVLWSRSGAVTGDHWHLLAWTSLLAFLLHGRLRAVCCTPEPPGLHRRDSGGGGARLQHRDCQVRLEDPLRRHQVRGMWQTGITLHDRILVVEVKSIFAKDNGDEEKQKVNKNTLSPMSPIRSVPG